MKRAGLIVAAVLALSCGGTPPIPDPAGFAVCVARCQPPGFCVHGAEGWGCVTPQPTPSPSASPTPSPTPPPADCRTLGCPPGHECLRGGRCGGADCFECFPIPTPTPTPSPSASPTPVPTPQPTATPCIPTTGPCVTRTEVVCFGSGPNPDGSQDPDIGCNTLPLGEKSAWSCQDIRDYMLKRVRQDDGTLAAPHWSGPINGLYYNDPDNDASRRQWYRAEDCSKVRPDGTLIYPMGHATGHFPYRKKVTREVCPTPQPCPSPSPTPGPTPSPTPTPGPGGGLKCTPLDSIGVAFHAQHPAPNGPLGYRWVFSATPKSVKPFCPEKRNECEQQAYQGDPVNDYENVVWRFDERFKCQDPAGPLWNQQEPHTGDSWENTDVRQENNYLANLKPAVKGKHVVRTCRRDQPSVCRYAEKVAN